MTDTVGLMTRAEYEEVKFVMRGISSNMIGFVRSYAEFSGEEPHFTILIADGGMWGEGWARNHDLDERTLFQVDHAKDYWSGKWDFSLIALGKASLTLLTTKTSGDVVKNHPELLRPEHSICAFAGSAFREMEILEGRRRRLIVSVSGFDQAADEAIATALLVGLEPPLKEWLLVSPG